MTRIQPARLVPDLSLVRLGRFEGQLSVSPPTDLHPAGRITLVDPDSRRVLCGVALNTTVEVLAFPSQYLLPRTFAVRHRPILSPIPAAIAVSNICLKAAQEI